MSLTWEQQSELLQRKSRLPQKPREKFAARLMVQTELCLTAQWKKLEDFCSQLKAQEWFSDKSYRRVKPRTLRYFVVYCLSVLVRNGIAERRRVHVGTGVSYRKKIEWRLKP